MPRTKAPKPADDADDAPLKRLGGGRWQTRDERFTIEPQSGTWVVVDAAQTDDFGLALVRGPFPSLTEAKAAISSARNSAPAASPLTARIDQGRNAPKPIPEPASGSSAQVRDTAEPRRRDVKAAPTTKPRRTRASSTDEPEEPSWLADLEAGERGRARRLIARLEEAGQDDAVSIVRRDVLGDVPAVATLAIHARLDELGDDATPARVAALLADGRDERLDVRWRLVDGQGRPIVLERKRAVRGR
jgi:hypothetical protein